MPVFGPCGSIVRIVVMPMAGAGTRFLTLAPDKKLAPIPPLDEPMFIHAIQHLGFTYEKLLLVPKEASAILSAIERFPSIAKLTQIIPTHTETKGPLDTVLHAKSVLQEYAQAELIICNCDQVLVWPGEWALTWLNKRGAQGGIPTIERNSPRHSYVKMDERYMGKIVQVREKEKISNRATIGVYWFRTVENFLKAAEQVIMHQDTAPNGEFYVSHVYNYLHGLILEYPLCEFWSLGEPENFTNYVAKDYCLGLDA